jgi:hypothetical protein
MQPIQNQRRVRFQEKECEVYTYSMGPLYHFEEQKRILWYQRDDFQQFKKNNKKLIREYRYMMKCSSQLSSIMASNDTNKIAVLNNRSVLEDEIRGLENHLSARAQLDFQHRKTACCRAVLHEQNKQTSFYYQQEQQRGIHVEPFERKMTTIDTKWIRTVSLRKTKMSKIMAYSLGKSDASYVRQLKKTKPCKGGPQVSSRQMESLPTAISNFDETLLTMKRIQQNIRFKDWSPTPGSSLPQHASALVRC